jgi:Tfp pilus assembly protein PilE
MKKLIFLNCLLFSIFFYAFDSTRDENRVVERLIPRPREPLLPGQYRPQEGFCANTLVKTPFGYKPIKKLNQDDIVIGSNGREKRIVAITKHYVNRCVKLIIHNTTMYTGYDQYYYKSPTCAGVKAHKLKAGDMLLNDDHEGSLVTYVELINENKLLYYLTVEDHIFCIAPCDVYVHNAEPLVLGLSSVCLGSITIINPITATIGATIALSAIAHKAYQAYMQQRSGNDSTISLPTNVILAERSYYIERSIALQGIKQELLSIKNGLENLKALCGSSSANFTYQFLKQTVPANIRQQNQLLQISATREMQLSDNQKENLRTLREVDLQYIEQEIVTLQTVLAFHINELIEQLYAAHNEYKSAGGETDTATILWNDNCNDMTDSIAFQSYKVGLLEDFLLKNLDQKVNELKIVAQYYHNCIKAVCIRQSTNIFDLLEKMNSVISEYDQKIAQEKSRIARNISLLEQHFECHGIFVGYAKNEIKTHLQKSRDGRNAQVIIEAQNKLESIVVAGSPQNKNNNNDDDENGHPFGKYEDAPYHTSFGNSIKSKAPSNGQRALDCSVSIGENSSRRIGISDGEFVVLDQTSPRLFHGHVRSWADLTDKMKKALVNSNLVSLKGKIK